MAKSSESQPVQAQAGSAAARGPRSPNFPAISLQDAIAKVKVLYEKDRRTSVSLKTVLTHFGFGEKLSGSTARVLSALRQFGLLDEVGGSYKVSEAAYHILSLSEASPDRLKAIQSCAKKPAIYRELLGNYLDGLPSEAAMKDYLILEKKFNPGSVDTFLRVFRLSMEFAKIKTDGYNEVNPQSDPGGPSSELAVGEFVQWVSQGVEQFKTPKKLIGISEDGDYGFIEGEATGVPMDQLEKAAAPPQDPRVPPPLPAHLATAFKPVVGMAREVSMLDEGEAMLQWPATVSSESVAELEAWLQLVIKKLKRRAGEAIQK